MSNLDEKFNKIYLEDKYKKKIKKINSYIKNLDETIEDFYELNQMVVDKYVKEAYKTSYSLEEYEHVNYLDQLYEKKTQINDLRKKYEDLLFEVTVPKTNDLFNEFLKEFNKIEMMLKHYQEYLFSSEYSDLISLSREIVGEDDPIKLKTLYTKFNNIKLKLNNMLSVDNIYIPDFLNDQYKELNQLDGKLKANYVKPIYVRHMTSIFLIVLTVILLVVAICIAAIMV